MTKSWIYAKSYGDVATIDITNFFIWTHVDRKPVEENIIMKIKELLVDMLVQMDPEKIWSQCGQ